MFIYTITVAGAHIKVYIIFYVFRMVQKLIFKVANIILNDLIEILLKK